MKTRLVISDFDGNSGIAVEIKNGFGESPLHGHDFYELDIILDGENRGTLNSEAISISKGDVFFMTPVDFHEYYEDGSVDILNIHFTSDCISASVFEKAVSSGIRHFRLNEKSFSDVKDLGSLILRFYSDRAGKDILSRLIESLLLLLLKDNKKQRPYQSEACEDIQKAIIYVGEHFRENPSLCKVASVIHLNERYFCKKFKEYTGESYKSYLKKLKLGYARRLLLATTYSMIRIAEMSGYQTQSHFNREFKEQYGLTPSEFRNQ